MTFICLLFGCAQSGKDGGESEARPALVPLMNAPEFDVEKVGEGRLKSAELKGKVVLIDFWATYCAPCKTEVPHFNALRERLKDKGVEIVGMTYLSGDAEDVKPYIKDWGIQYPIAMGTEELDAALGGHIGLPTTFLVGKDWKVYRKILGTRAGKLKQLEADINELLRVAP